MRVRNLASVAATAVCMACAALLSMSCVPVQSGAGAGTDGDSTGARIMRALNLRIYGAGNTGTAPILRLRVDGQPSTGIGHESLTAEFEMQSDGYPTVALMLVHCDRYWNPTENIFVQDPTALRGTDFVIERAPLGVTHYDYILRTTFPNSGGRPAIQYAGNYLARIVDYYDNNRILAEARFFAVEPRTSVGVENYSDFYESAQSKVLQHGLKIRVEALPSNNLFGGEMNGIQLYESGHWYEPLIADAEHQGGGDKGEPWITWWPTILGKSSAMFANLPGGNEHRILDLTDITQFPTVSGVVSTGLSDIPRQSFLVYDNNGIPAERSVSLSDADYVNFQFRLDLEGKSVREDLFVVGTFNDWLPTPEWQLHFDEASGLYAARGLIRRARHEYMYMAGAWDADRSVLRNADATLLEWNLRNAIQAHYAFVYYHDNTGGGYDKIVGAALTLSGTLR